MIHARLDSQGEQNFSDAENVLVIEDVERSEAMKRQEVIPVRGNFIVIQEVREIPWVEPRHREVNFVVVLGHHGVPE